MGEGPATDGGPSENIVERTVEPVEGEANLRVLEAVAEVEDVDAADLPPLYDRIDHVIDELFSDPPADEAQAEVTFSYYGYRVTITQWGTIRLRKVADPGET